MFLFQSGPVQRKAPEQSLMQRIYSLQDEFYRMQENAQGRPKPEDLKALGSNVESLNAAACSILAQGMDAYRANRKEIQQSIAFCRAAKAWLDGKGVPIPLSFEAKASVETAAIEKRYSNYFTAAEYSFAYLGKAGNAIMVNSLARALDSAGSEGGMADWWGFGFNKKGGVSAQKQAEQFFKMLSALPGVKPMGEPEILAKAVGFTDEKIVSFRLEEDAKKKGKLAAEEPPVFKFKKKETIAPEQQVAISRSQGGASFVTSHTGPVADANYAKIQTADESENSSNSGNVILRASSSLPYAWRYTPNSSEDGSLTKNMVDFRIWEMAKRYGFSVREPLIDFLKSSEGQRFIGLINDNGGISNISGSATQEAFYSGTRYEHWLASVLNNYSLAQERAGLAAKAMVEINDSLAKAGKQAINLKSDMQSSVYFFQELSPELLAKVIASVEALKDAKKFAAYSKDMEARKVTVHKPEFEPVLQQLKDMQEQQSDAAYKKNMYMQALVDYLRRAAEQKGVSGKEKEAQDAERFLKTMIADKAIDANYQVTDTLKFKAYFQKMRGDKTAGLHEEEINGKKVRVEGYLRGMRNEGKRNIFVRAMEECNELIGMPSGRSVSLLQSAEVSISASISKVVDNKAEVTVNKYTIGNASIPPTDATVSVRAFLVKDATKPSERIELKVSYNASSGKFSVSIPEELQGENYKVVAYAETKGGEINSGLVWRKYEMAIKEFYEPRTEASYSSGVSGRMSQMTFSTYYVATPKSGGPSREVKADAILSFGVKTKNEKLGYAPAYFMYPGEKMELKEGQLVYHLGNDYVVIDRALDAGKKTLTQKQIEDYLQSGVVGIKVQAMGGDAWARFDGELLTSEQIKQAKLVPTGDLLKGKAELLKLPVLSFYDQPNAVRGRGRYHIPNAVAVVSEDDSDLAEEHIFAKVEPVLNDPKHAKIVRLDGRVLGTINIEVEERGSKAEKEYQNNLKIAKQLKAVDGLFIYEQNTSGQEQGKVGTFKYSVYCPRGIPLFDRVIPYVYTALEFQPSSRGR